MTVTSESLFVQWLSLGSSRDGLGPSRRSVRRSVLAAPGIAGRTRTIAGKKSFGQMSDGPQSSE